MQEFVKKLIERLEEWDKHSQDGLISVMGVADIVNQLAEEYNNDFCEWEYDDFEDGWQTSCGTTFSLCDSDKEITHYCPYCGKKIKVVE